MCKEFCSNTVALKSSKAHRLDTLAQIETPKNYSSDNQDITEFPKLGKTTSSNDSKRLQSRAKNKYLGRSLALALVDVAAHYRDSATTWKEYNEEQTHHRSYWNMFYCASKLEVDGDKVKGKYCKNRLCLVCNRIRMAECMNKYVPVLNSWFDDDDVYFVTLTIPNCKAEKLRDSIKYMDSVRSKIQGSTRKRLSRLGGPKLMGIRKFECTYNPRTDTYHPHYHLLIKGKDNALEFYNKWIKHTSVVGSKQAGQDIVKANRNTPLELFKYFTKIVSYDLGNGDSKPKKLVYAEALHTIFKAVKGTRTLEYFGPRLPKVELKEDQYELDVPEELNGHDGEQKETYIWQQDIADWVSNISGQTLSGFKLTEELKEIPKSIVRIRAGSVP